MNLRIFISKKQHPLKPLNLLFIFFFFAPLFSTVAQQESNYYLNVIDTTLNKETKLSALDSLLSINLQKNNLEAFIDNSITYICLAEEIGNYEAMAEKTINVSHSILDYKNDPKLSVGLITEALEYQDKFTDSYLKAGLHLKRGGAFFEFNIQNAFEDYTKAIETFEDKDAIYKADAFLFRGQANSTLGQFVSASEDFNAAYELYEKENDLEYMVHARSGEILMFSKNGFYEKSIEERTSLIEYLLESKLNKLLSIHYYNQSIDYKKSQKPDLRYKYLQKALESIDTTADYKYTYIAIHASLSEYFSSNNKLQKALDHLNQSEKYLDVIPNNPYAKSIYLMALIQYQLNNNQLIDARDNSLKRLNLMKDIGLNEESIFTHKILSDIYIKLNKYELALKQLNIYTKLKDSIFSQSKTNALVYYQTLYETERRKKMLNEKENNIALLKGRNNHLKRQYLFGGVAMTFGFLLLFLYKNQKNLKTNKKLQEKYTQDLLLAQEDERKRVSKDLHDGIGQSLLLIKNKVVLNKDETAKDLVESAIEEVRSISRALHPFQLQELGITKAIQNIFYQIDDNTELFITTKIDPIDNLFSVEQEVNLYRTIQESINNVIKHSKATAVRFSINKFDKNIHLILKDNGVGFDFSQKYNDFNSLGLKTLKERTRLLNGVMKVDTQTGKGITGTTIEFIIPIKRA